MSKIILTTTTAINYMQISPILSNSLLLIASMILPMKYGTAKSEVAPPTKKNKPNMIEQHSRLAYPSTNLKLPFFLPLSR